MRKRIAEICDYIRCVAWLLFHPIATMQCVILLITIPIWAPRIEREVDEMFRALNIIYEISEAATKARKGAGNESN